MFETVFLRRTSPLRTVATSNASTSTSPSETSESSSDSSSTDTPADSSTGPVYECGNGIIEGDEVCDGEELGGEDCLSRGFDGGELACAVTCTGYDTSGCTSISDPNDNAAAWKPYPAAAVARPAHHSGVRSSEVTMAELIPASWCASWPPGMFPRTPG